MLRILNLNKIYSNGVQALKNISLNIKKGIFGLLGSNGAGKSTLMRTIATLQDPDKGSVNFHNIDVLNQKEQMRRVLGYLPQEFGLYPNVSCEDLLHHLAILKGIVNSKKRKEEVEYILEVTNLLQHRKQSLGSYSGGMKQRFGIAQALLGNPSIIIVDEPTAGLDIDERNRFHNLLATIGENKTLILSTHIVFDVSELCSEMAIMHKGHLLAQISPTEAIEKLQGKLWKILVPQSEVASFSQKYNMISSRFFRGSSKVKVFSDTNPGEGFECIEPDLEDVYFSYIKNYITE